MQYSQISYCTLELIGIYFSLFAFKECLTNTSKLDCDYFINNGIC